jgi:hypothetical protein
MVRPVRVHRASTLNEHLHRVVTIKLSGGIGRSNMTLIHGSIGPRAGGLPLGSEVDRLMTEPAPS